jgi:RNA polymerase sigma-70 factor, ECF subfamily
MAQTHLQDPDEIYRTYVRQVGRWVIRLGGPAVDVEDTVHEVFAVAFRRLASFRGDSSMATWLFGITDKVVRQRRPKHRWWQWLTGGAEETAGSLPARGADPFEAFEKEEVARHVYRVLDRLSQAHRRILILVELEGLSAGQVGELLGIKEGAVRVRLHRARARFLRAYLREFPALEPDHVRCGDVGR